MTETLRREVPIPRDNFVVWSTEDVVQWCIVNLDVNVDDVLCSNIRDNDIAGDVLSQLTLEDCKELTNGDLKKAVRLKLSISKLIEDHKEKDNVQEEDIVVVLKNLYTAVSQKLADYQTQYAGLRTDMLEIMRKSNSGENTLTTGSPQSTTPGSGSKPANSRLEYFDQNHRYSRSRSRERPTLQQNKSSQTNFKGGEFAGSSSQLQTVKPASPAEPFKQLKASKEDSCERILKNAMMRHNLNDQDWKQYVLVISYGDQERILDLNEKPVVIFKNLKRQGLHPSIMLRRRGDFEEVGMFNGLSAADITPGGRL
ncbi:Protein STE50 [Nakaseomyces bracarensis]|uniref:Protein STE50 n=1 Tax=Nakaseomyces bracarensis TaxID=273131 RepID=A0ABR4NYK4_9SACH